MAFEIWTSKSGQTCIEHASGSLTLDANELAELREAIRPVRRSYRRVASDENAEIVRRYLAGERPNKLAAAFNLSPGTIGGIISRAGVGGKYRPDRQTAE